MKLKKFDKLSEEELLSLMKEGDTLAFHHVYIKYWKCLYIYTYKILKDEHACEDIIQEVFVNLWLSNRKNGINNVKAYLFRAVKYRAANYIRDMKWVTDHDEALQKVVSNLNAENPLELEEMRIQIDGSIHSLPEKCREAFKLYHHEGLSVSEISSNLNISIRTVETHIYNARQILKKKLSKLATLLSLLLSFFC